MNEGAIDVDAVLSLCRDRHRRIVLATLAQEQRPLTVDDLAKTVVERDRGTPAAEVPSETLTRVRLSLYHEHVPLLASEGVVEFDAERRRVEPAVRLDRLQPHLATIVDLDPDLEAPVER